MIAVMPPGQQREHQGFARLAWQSQLVAWAHSEAMATRLQFPHQSSVAATSTGHHHLYGQGKVEIAEML